MSTERPGSAERPDCTERPHGAEPPDVAERPDGADLSDSAAPPHGAERRDGAERPDGERPAGGMRRWGGGMTWRADPEDRPGDPVCWLPRVCQVCGALADEDPPTTCRRCGSEMSGA